MVSFSPSPNSERQTLTYSAELSFAENDTITNLEFPDDDWWFGHLRGDSGLFPANYVQIDA